MRICMVNHVQTGYLAVRCLESALEIREPSRFVLALSLEAVALCMVPMEMFQRRAEAMLQRAQKLAEGHGGDYHRALLLSGMGAREWLRGAFAPSVRYMDEASELVSRSVQGVSWEHALFDNWAFSALSLQGRFRELGVAANWPWPRASNATTATRPATRRWANPYLPGSPRTSRPKHASLPSAPLPGHPKSSRHSTTTTTFPSPTFGCTRATSRGAHELSEAVWPLLTTNMYLWNAMVRDELTQLRGRTALGLAACSEAMRSARC